MYMCPMFALFSDSSLSLVACYKENREKALRNFNENVFSGTVVIVLS